MAQSALSLPRLLFFIVLVCFSSDANIRLANGQSPGQKTWCVAKPSSSDAALKDNIQYACDHVDWKNCSLILEGGSCSNPNTLMNQASVVMNVYYQNNHRNYWNCYFGNSGLIVFTDPSYGNCKYEYAE